MGKDIITYRKPMGTSTMYSLESELIVGVPHDSM